MLSALAQACFADAHHVKSLLLPLMQLINGHRKLVRVYKLPPVFSTSKSFGEVSQPPFLFCPRAALIVGNTHERWYAYPSSVHAKQM